MKGGKLRLRFVGSDLVPVVPSPSVLFYRGAVLIVIHAPCPPASPLPHSPQTNVSLSFMSFQSLMCLFLSFSFTKARPGEGVSQLQIQNTLFPLYKVCVVSAEDFC